MLSIFNQFPEGQIIAFSLVLLRMMAFVVAMPLIGTPSVPVVVKVLLSLTMAIVIFPTLKFSNADLLRINDEVLFFAIREVVVGLFLGFMMRLFFFAIQVAGEIVGVSSGLASAQLYNPLMGGQSNVFEQFFMILATLFFFGLNGHHIFIQGIVESYSVATVANMAIRVEGFTSIVIAFREVLLVGVKLAAPIMVAIFMANLAMGVLGRAVPQMNVFVTSLQVTVLITLFLLMMTVPFFVEEMEYVVTIMADQFHKAMRVI